MADRRDPYFCLVPWTHLNVQPNGDFMPCCVWQQSMPLGNVHKSSLRELYNSPKMCELRSNVLGGKPSAGCARCYELEKSGASTKRLAFNRHFSHLMGLTETTKIDGSLENLQITSFDVRFSNLCNLRCRSCGPGLSSSWYADFVKAYGDPGHPKNLNCGSDEKFFAQILQLLPGVEYIEFAGGEPLLDSRHWDLLRRLVDLGKTDVGLLYTTNFTTLDFKGQSVTPLWKKFRNIHVGASLDASGARADYLRKGMQWTKVEANRERLALEAPNVQFFITPTISMFNVWHFPDFHLDWVKRGFIKAEDAHLNILTTAPEMSIKVLPKKSKKEVETKIRKAMDIFSHKVVRDRYESVIEFMNSEDHQRLLPRFFHEAQRLDQVRGENLLEVFPELAPMVPRQRLKKLYWFVDYQLRKRLKISVESIDNTQNP